MLYTLQELRAEQIADSLLDDFQRHQETERCYRLLDGKLQLCQEYFRDDWDQQEKRQRTARFREAVTNGGVLIAAMQEQRCLGFALLASEAKETHLELKMIHVSRELRGQGIGSALFRAACEAARRKRARYLYLAAHPSYETMQFYWRQGCSDARDIEHLFPRSEPSDLPLRLSLWPKSGDEGLSG